MVASVVALSGCAPRVADFNRDVTSPSGKTIAHFAGYQPRGTIEGYLTVSFISRSGKTSPQLTFGHMLGVRAGWLDDHSFAFVYDLLEQRHFASPVYPTEELSSAVQIVSCNRHYVDCTSIMARLSPKHSIAMPQFPEGSWSANLGVL